MTKQAWIEHIEHEGIYRPSRGGDKELWKSIVLRHQIDKCAICKERANTKRRKSI